jgi:predicted RNA-binding protein with PIN domain
MIIVDGHNLIPKIKGLSLKMLDDESELIQILQEYARLTRKKIEVYFDGAPLEHAGSRKIGTIHAHFINIQSSADAAIINRVRKMGRKALQVKVVSSDLRIQQQIRACQAQVIPSEEFAKDIQKTFTARPSGTKPDATKMSPAEVDKWLELFKNKPGKLK